MSRHDLVLISHHLCPYVQRAAISLAEKGVPFQRRYVDLADKPDWFRTISPLGKVPVLLVGDTPLFESAAILEFLEDTRSPPLHPRDPLLRAGHRAWIEVGSTILNGIGAFYGAKTDAAFDSPRETLKARFGLLNDRLNGGPYFDGQTFSLVDAVFGPVFRYFDVFDEIGEFGILAGMNRVSRWRTALAERPSVKNAVSGDYPERLMDFLKRRDSALSALIR